MTTDYDPIAEQYQLCKLQDWRRYVEAHTFMEVVGEVRGDVIDIACGEGFYTRLMKQSGAGRVTGIDLSRQMIELARRQEEVLDLGIEYVCGDACLLPASGDCDLAVAAYLLNYAHNRKELQSMCDAVARVLKPGGRFVTVNSNPACDFPSAPSYRKYGFDTEALGTWREGAAVRWTFYLDQGPFDIENYYLDTPIHEEALTRAGFENIRWHRPRVSAAGVEKEGQEYWADLLGHPPITFLECRRS